MISYPLRLVPRSSSQVEGLFSLLRAAPWTSRLYLPFNRPTDKRDPLDRLVGDTRGQPGGGFHRCPLHTPSVARHGTLVKAPRESAGAEVYIPRAGFLILYRRRTQVTDQPGNVVPLPTLRSPLSFAPLDMAPDFDLLDELCTNRNAYTGGENWLTIYSFPGYLLTQIEKIREKVLRATSSRPGISPVLNCAIAHGIHTIATNEHIENLVGLRGKLHALDPEDADDIEDIAWWFRTFRIGIPDNTMVGNTRVNLALTEDVRSTLREVSDDLGPSSSNLAVLSTIVTLSTQTCIHRQRRAEMEKATKNLWRRARLRVAAAEALIKHATS